MKRLTETFYDIKFSKSEKDRILRGPEILIKDYRNLVIFLLFFCYLSVIFLLALGARQGALESLGAAFAG